MKRRTFLHSVLGAAAVVACPALALPTLPQVEVFRHPDCGCCGAWVEHLRAAGFRVRVNAVMDTSPVRQRYGIPEQFGSCHTAVIDGYALEGHVPAAEIKRLLTERPAATGLSVPGMPVGSPGMEAGPRIDPYQVLLIDKTGRPSVFASYPKR